MMEAANAAVPRITPQQGREMIAKGDTLVVDVNRTYAGFNCTVDCSGHEAGYRWAERNSIDDEDYCPDGDSESFHEGCIAYVEGESQAANDSGIRAGMPMITDPDDDDDSK
jgi:hypothetical protein